MNSTILIIFFVILAVVGIICLYNGYDMKVNGNLKIGWFVGQDIKMEKCKDVPGFINATFKPIMIFGTGVVISALVMLIIEGVKGPKPIQMLFMLIIFVLFFWFNRQITKATDKFLK